jgi:hypothetical protein
MCGFPSNLAAFGKKHKKNDWSMAKKDFLVGTIGLPCLPGV